MTDIHYYARFPGDFYPMDVYAASESGARTQLRAMLDLDRLPRGTEVWKANPVPLDPDPYSAQRYFM